MPNICYENERHFSSQFLHLQTSQMCYIESAFMNNIISIWNKFKVGD